ncbi:hypothetical protein NUSPORA_00996 [Nucleospora cyclopteri]
MELLILIFFKNYMTSQPFDDQNVSNVINQQVQPSTSTSQAFTTNPQINIVEDSTLSDNESSNEDSEISDYSASSESFCDFLSTSFVANKYYKLKNHFNLIKAKKKRLLSYWMTLQCCLDQLPEEKTDTKAFLNWKIIRCYKNIKKLRKHQKYSILCIIQNSLNKLEQWYADFINNDFLTMSSLNLQKTPKNEMHCCNLEKLKRKIICLCNLKFNTVLNDLTQQISILEHKKEVILQRYGFLNGFIEKKCYSVHSKLSKQSPSISVNDAVKQIFIITNSPIDLSNPYTSFFHQFHTISENDIKNLKNIFFKLFGALKLKFWVYNIKKKSIGKDQKQMEVLHKKKLAIFRKFIFCKVGFAILEHSSNLTGYKSKEMDNECIENASLQELKEYNLLLEKRKNSVQKQLQDVETQILELYLQYNTEEITNEIENLNKCKLCYNLKFQKLFKQNNYVLHLIDKLDKSSLPQKKQKISISCFLIKNKTKIEVLLSICFWLERVELLLLENIYDLVGNTSKEDILLIKKCISNYKTKFNKLKTLNDCDVDSTKSSECE